MEWSTEKTRKLTVLAMLSALAFLLTYIFHILPIPPLMPAAPFLNYEPKDVIVVIAGFIYGPLAVVPMALVIALLEMPISGTGIIGVLMNTISTCAFACMAAFIYKGRRTLAGAAIGLVVGVIVMVGIMVLWNYFLTPIFMGVPRPVVRAMLVPVIMPFNLIKGGMNAALTMMLYKSVRVALDKSKLLPIPTDGKSKHAIGAILVSALVLASCILIILSWQGII